MNFQRPSKKTVMIISIVAVITLLLSSALSIWLSEVTDIDVPTIGTIKTIGVEAYWDKDLENKTEEFNWDIIWLGTSKNVTFYVRSISNEKIILLLKAANWNPIDTSKYMNLSWNYDGTPIDTGEVIRVTITLSTPPSVRFMEYVITNEVKEFSLDIVIQAIE